MIDDPSVKNIWDRLTFEQLCDQQDYDGIAYKLDSIQREYAKLDAIRSINNEHKDIARFCIIHIYGYDVYTEQCGIRIACQFGLNDLIQKTWEDHNYEDEDSDDEDFGNNVQRNPRLDPESVRDGFRIAAKFGNLHTIHHMIHEFGEEMFNYIECFLKAVEGGQLHIVNWCLENVSEPFSMNALNTAIKLTGTAANFDMFMYMHQLGAKNYQGALVSCAIRVNNDARKKGGKTVSIKNNESLQALLSMIRFCEFHELEMKFHEFATRLPIPAHKLIMQYKLQKKGKHEAYEYQVPPGQITAIRYGKGFRKIVHDPYPSRKTKSKVPAKSKKKAKFGNHCNH